MRVNLRKQLRESTRALGLDGFARRSYVEAGLLGERLQRAIRGTPKPADAALLVSGGRAGSTWIADILASCNGVQQIFEPLHPSAMEEVRRLTNWDESRHPHIRSIYLRPGECYPDWEGFLDRVLTGRVRNYWTDAVRTSFLPRRYLVKLIRANLMVGFLVDRFAPRVAFVVRHPCAVVSSRLVTGWHADVRDILCQEDLVEDHLRPWLSEVEAERDLVGAHAVWWAVENFVASRQLATRPHYFATYESIVSDPLAEMVQMAEALGISSEGLAGVDFEAPSRMASMEVRMGGGNDSHARWRDKLGAEDQRRILEWARSLGVDWYESNGRPKVASGRVPEL